MRILRGVNRLSPKTEAWFVIISHSKLNPFQEDKVCARVINSSRNGVSWVVYRQIRNTRCVRFVVTAIDKST